MRYIYPALSKTKDEPPSNAFHAISLLKLKLVESRLIEAMTPPSLEGGSNPDIRASDYVSKGERTVAYLK